MSIEGIDLESNSIIGAGVGAVVTAITWFVRTVFSGQKEQREKIAKLEVELAKSYVPREEIESRFDRIQESVEKRFDRLEEKFDKVLDFIHAPKP